MKNISSWAWNKGESHQLYGFNREEVTETHVNVEWSKCRERILLDYGKEEGGRAGCPSTFCALRCSVLVMNS